MTEEFELSEREKSVLRYVVHQFILTAAPVGSRNISKRYDLGVSSATIRNIMADLEETGFLGHPHTSAGRVPTDKGYRFYVDTLMDPPLLDKKEKKLIENNIETALKKTGDFLRIASTILSELTNQLACVTYPKLDKAVLEKLQIIPLSSSKILVIVEIDSGIVKTITLEINIEVSREKLQGIQRLLNERLSGLSLSEIKKSFKERIKDKIEEEYKPVIRLFADSADKIFDDPGTNDKVYITGAKKILNQPEFADHSQLQSVLDLIEDKNIIVHIMESKENEDDLVITIGSENREEKFTGYSFIKKDYTIGDASGKLGVVGPKRMQYSKTVAVIVYLSELLSKEIKSL